MADYYVDFGATNDGDGTAYTQASGAGLTGAFNTIVGKTFSTGDKVWMRRVAKTITTAPTFAVAGVLYIGWPLSGDDYYSTRPGGTTWDGDGGTYAELNTVTNSLAPVLAANSIELHRFKISTTAASPGIPLTINTGITDSKIKKCLFAVAASGGASSTRPLLLNTTCDRTTITDCTLTHSNYSTSVPFLDLSSGASIILRNLAVTITTTAATSTLINHTGTGLSLSDVTFTIGTITSTLQGCNFIGTLASIVNLTFTATTVSGNTGTLATFGGTNQFVKNFRTNFGTQIVCSGAGSDIDVTLFTQKTATTSGVNITGNGVIFSGSNMTFAATNSTADVLISGLGVMAYMRNCLFVAAVPVSDTSNSTTRWFSFDHNQIANAWQTGSPAGTATGSTVVRTGGETYSLKAQGASQSTVNRPIIQISPRGQETIWLSLTTGARTVTLYGAYKNYASLVASDIWIETEYLSGAPLLVPVSTFVFNGALTTDTSTWTGDSGLTKFLLTLSFTLPSNQVCPVRLYLAKYAASSYVYIDPKPVVT